MKRLWPILSLFIGTLLGLTGVCLIVGYVMEAVIARYGDNDQSLLYWYLPFLLFGVIGLIAGAGLIIRGFGSLKKGKK